MKALKYLGLVIFYGGIILYFLRRYRSDFLSHIDESYIEIIWPIGLIIYGIALYFIQQNNKESKA